MPDVDGIEVPKPLTLPVVHIVADNIAEGWEKAVLATWGQGVRIKTQYDPPDAPPSSDVHLLLVVRDAFAEPRIHRAFPGGITELEAYRQEVVDGIHDHWVNPEEGKWEYTYHERFTRYTHFKYVGCHPKQKWLDYDYNPVSIDQIDYIVSALVEAPHTRRAQAITWIPGMDAGISDPPCLQRIWCRIFGDELVMSIDIRSNDGFKAAFMNIFAFTDLQRAIAERVSEGLGRLIRPGQYIHNANSFHIYGVDFPDFSRFLESLERRGFEDRTWRSDDPVVVSGLQEANIVIPRSLRHEKKTGAKGIYDCTCCREGE